jgi:hypothetical protein
MFDKKHEDEIAGQLQKQLQFQQQSLIKNMAIRQSKRLSG